MKKVFIYILLLSFGISNDIYKQIRIDNISQDDISLFRYSGIDIDHADYQSGQYIEFAISEYDLSILDALGYEYHIIHEDLQVFYESRLTENYSREFGLGSMGGYYTLEESVQRLDDIHEEYPEFVSEKISLGQSFQGRDIYAIKVSANVDIDEDEPEVLYTGLHHAREPMGFMNLYYFIYWILENYGVDDRATQILDTREMWFIPIVNPDGYEYNRSIAPNGGGMQRKNMRETCNSSADGVDLNRNYGYAWNCQGTYEGDCDMSGSSGSGCNETYRGSSAFSEPETQIVRDFVYQHDFKIALNYHAYGNYLIHPWGYNNTGLALPEEDNETYQEIGQEATIYNNYFLGTGYETVGYGVNGDSDDWMYGEEGIITYTPEIGTNSDGFWPSSNRIVPLAEENLHPNIVIALYAGALVSSELNIEDGPYVSDDSYTMDVLLSNIGLSPSNGTITLEFVADAGIDFLDPIIEISDLDPRTSINLDGINEFSISPFVPSGTELEISLVMSLQDGSESISSTSIITGVPEAVVEYDFEVSSDADDWELSGNSDWHITSENSNSGSSSFRSGVIGDNQESTASITLDALSVSTIEFSYRVSSEYSPSGNNFYDGLTFYIDNEQIGQYQPDGDGQSPWIDYSHSLDSGTHVLRWTYSKDGGGGATDCNNTNCDDAAFIDNFVMYSYVDDEPLVPGDLNFDANVDVLDVVLLVNFVLETTNPTDLEFEAGDINSDGILNVLDIVQVVNLILS